MGGVRVYTREGCPSCSRVLLALQRTGNEILEIDVREQPKQWEKLCMICTGLQVTDLPQVFAGFKHIGGVEEILELESSGELKNEILMGLSDESAFDLSHVSSRIGSESKQTTTDVSAEVSISISEMDGAPSDGSEEDAFVQMRIKEAVMSWSGARVTPASSDTEEDMDIELVVEQEEQPRRATRGAAAVATGGGRLTPKDAVRAMARAVGVLPGTAAGERDTLTRETSDHVYEEDQRSHGEVEHGNRRPADDRARTGELTDLEGREYGEERKREERKREERKREPKESIESVKEDQSERRQRIKTAIRSWTGSEALEPEERIEQAIKLWRGGEDEEGIGLASPSHTQARGRGINAKTKILLPIASKRSSSPDAEEWERSQEPRLSGVLGLRETLRPASARGEKWEQCWFVLYDSELLCFHSQKEEKRAFPIHAWFLSCAQVSVPMVTSTLEKGSRNHHNVLRLRTVMGKVLSEYFLSAKSKRVLDRWILEINEAIESCSRPPFVSVDSALHSENVADGLVDNASELPEEEQRSPELDLRNALPRGA